MTFASTNFVVLFLGFNTDILRCWWAALDQPNKERDPVQSSKKTCPRGIYCEVRLFFSMLVYFSRLCLMVSGPSGHCSHISSSWFGIGVKGKEYSMLGLSLQPSWHLLSIDENRAYSPQQWRNNWKESFQMTLRRLPSVNRQNSSCLIQWFVISIGGGMSLHYMFSKINDLVCFWRISLTSFLGLLSSSQLRKFSSSKCINRPLSCTIIPLKSELSEIKYA